MKLPGLGYTPRISGRPSRKVAEVPVPAFLRIELKKKDFGYIPLPRIGQSISTGESLGRAEKNGVALELPSPVSGRVSDIEGDNDYLIVEVSEEDSQNTSFEPLKPQYATPDKVRDTLRRGGMWPAFWSSVTHGIPVADGSEIPKTVIVNFVIAEPFHARGRVILTRSWDDIIEGIRFLPRLMEDYGKVEVILTAVRDPVAQKMYRELSGFAWVRLHPVPVRYPVENPRVLIKALRKNDRAKTADEVSWTVDAQGIAQMGALLSRGKIPQRRLVTLGGPGIKDPMHYSACIGTPLKALASGSVAAEAQVVLRGGVLAGSPLDIDRAAVGFDDDGFFFLPEAAQRQSFSFLRPGFDRTSAFPAFAGSLIGKPDSHVTASLRGEVRPCIACGICEKICPVGLMPQVIHRYLYRDMPEEAQKAGLDICIDCYLCTFVCPSKIELQKGFEDARAQLREERLEAEI